MFYIRRKDNGAYVESDPGIRFVNRAPSREDLGEFDPSIPTGVRIWHAYDAALHDVVESNGELPDYHDLEPGDDGIYAAVPWNLERRVSEGVESIDPTRKAVGDELVPKTRQELVADGLIPLNESKRWRIAAVERKAEEVTARGMIRNGLIWKADNSVWRYLIGLTSSPRPVGWSKTWYTLDGQNEATLTESDLQPFLDDLTSHLEAIKTEKHVRIVAIMRETDQAVVESSDYTSGWTLPATVPPED